jgi:hypothetical protein
MTPAGAGVVEATRACFRLSTCFRPHHGAGAPPDAKSGSNLAWLAKASQAKDYVTGISLTFLRGGDPGPSPRTKSFFEYSE